MNGDDSEDDVLLFCIGFPVTLSGCRMRVICLRVGLRPSSLSRALASTA